MGLSVDTSSDSQGQQLDVAPPRPPRNRQSLMAMAAGPKDDGDTGFDTSSPAIQTMKAMGEAKNALLKLGSYLPTIAPGIQQIIAGLESVVPQQVADMIAGNPPGSSGSGLGAAGANQAPTAPQVQGGMT